MKLLGEAWLVFRLPAAAMVLLMLGLTAGCKVGPEYARPSVGPTNAPLPAAWTFGGKEWADWKTATPAAHLPRGEWWRIFDDPVLHRLAMLANSNNQAVAAAVAHFDAARAEVNLVRADLFPQVELDPSYTRQRNSANEPQSGHASGSAYTYNTFTMSLQAGWEADLWGRVRRQVASARAQLAADAADLENVRLAIQAELAVDYFAVRALEAETGLVKRTIASYGRSLELTRNRRRGGIATDLDVSQAETQLRTTEALLPVLELDRTRLVHALAALCGQLAMQFDLPARASSATNLVAVPRVMPSELLERRPDIAAAERRMASANSQIGVAQSAFYPRIRLNGLAGFQSLNASSWFDWPSRLWAVGPSLQWPLFAGGRNRAQLALARATYEETVAQYRQTVLVAFQEVQDQIAVQIQLDRELTAQTAAMQSARRTVEIATNRYKAGLVTYLEVANAQRAALAIERTVVQIQGQKNQAAVALVRVLGGGWPGGT